MWFNLCVVIFLVIMSGVFAGLTLALFSLSLTSLERKVKLGNPQAQKVYRIRKNGNLLLCTLLLGNTLAYTTMAVFLGSITSGVVAGMVATGLIFLFGEILPQAVFPRYALSVGAKLSWLVWIALIVFYPIAGPISWVLNKVLGKEPPVMWGKKELEEIIKYHEDVGDGIIDRDEKRIVLGALSFSELQVNDIMIPRPDVYHLKSDDKINAHVFQRIRQWGVSRIPVLDITEMDVVGILYTKDLIGLTNNEGRTAHDLCSTNMILVQELIKLDDLLNLLVNRKMHMAIVVDRNGHFIGVATIEDIMEEILKTELEDLKT